MICTWFTCIFMTSKHEIESIYLLQLLHVFIYDYKTCVCVCINCCIYYMLSFKLHTCKLLVSNGYSMLRLYMVYMFLHDFKTCAWVCIFCCNCCMYMVLHVLTWLQNMSLSLYILLQLLQRFIHYFKHVFESVYLVATITCLL